MREPRPIPTADDRRTLRALAARVREIADDPMMPARRRRLSEHNALRGDRPLVLVNPEIVWASDERAVAEEGCLSVPQVYDKVERHARVKVRALDRDGQPFELDAEGLSAVCVQHEMGHLRGKVFVEYLSLLKRDRIRTKMLKRTRDEQRTRA